MTMATPDPTSTPPEFYHRYEQIRERLEAIGEALFANALEPDKRVALKQERGQLIDELAVLAGQGRIRDSSSVRV